MSGLVWSAAAWLIKVYRFRLAALLMKPQMCGSRCLPYCVLLCCTHHHKGAAAPQSTSAPAAAPGGSQQYFAQLNVAITLEMRLPIKVTVGVPPLTVGLIPAVGTCTDHYLEGTCSTCSQRKCRSHLRQAGQDVHCPLQPAKMPQCCGVAPKSAGPELLSCMLTLCSLVLLMLECHERAPLARPTAAR